MESRVESVLVLGGLVMVLMACKQEQLSAGGAQVATSQSAPVDSGWDPSSCKSLGYLIGRGGGTFGGGWIANDKLIEYAMNDLRNQAEKLGANFVQHDSPTMGQGGDKNGTTTTTATVSGTAYRCEKKRGVEEGTVEASAPAKPATACVPGATQACLGPAACSGAQFCLDDGSRFSPCDCGGQQVVAQAEAPDASKAAGTPAAPSTTPAASATPAAPGASAAPAKAPSAAPAAKAPSAAPPAAKSPSK